MEEEWRYIVGFPNYQISNCGRVRSLDKVVSNKLYKGKILKTQLTYKGYVRVTLQHDGVKKTLQVHRLVGLAFIPNPQNEPQINHKNGVKTDNTVENLEWCNGQYNITHSWAVLGRKPPKKCGQPKKKVAMINKNTNEVIKIFDCIRDASLYICGSEKFRRNIAKTAKGDYGRKTCCGYKWKFI